MKIKKIKGDILMISLLIIFLGGFLFFTREPKLYDYEISEYFGVIKFSEESKVGATNPLEEYFSIIARNLEEEISLKGWSVERLSDKENFPFPPVSFDSLLENIKEEELVLRRDAILVVSSGRSPVGKSFAVNECSGYVQQIFSFSPPIKEKCPSPIEVFDTSKVLLTNECRIFLSELPACNTPTSKEDQILSNLDNECISFVREELNEPACVDRMKVNTNFFTGEYRIFLNQINEIWRKGDTLVLLDSFGKAVDSITYK